MTSRTFLDPNSHGRLICLSKSYLSKEALDIIIEDIGDEILACFSMDELLSRFSVDEILSRP